MELKGSRGRRQAESPGNGTGKQGSAGASPTRSSTRWDVDTPSWVTHGQVRQQSLLRAKQQIVPRKGPFFSGKAPDYSRDMDSRENCYILTEDSEQGEGRAKTAKKIGIEVGKGATRGRFRPGETDEVNSDKQEEIE